MKTKVRAREVSQAVSRSLPATKAPKEPSALPSVPMSASTRPVTPSASDRPAPVGPSTPVACASSTYSMAPWRWQRSAMPESGAASPSMPNTASVTTSLRRAVVSASRRASASRSQWG